MKNPVIQKLIQETAEDVSLDLDDLFSETTGPFTLYDLLEALKNHGFVIQLPDTSADLRKKSKTGLLGFATFYDQLVLEPPSEEKESLNIFLYVTAVLHAPVGYEHSDRILISFSVINRLNTRRIYDVSCRYRPVKKYDPVIADIYHLLVNLANNLKILHQFTRDKKAFMHALKTLTAPLENFRASL